MDIAGRRILVDGRNLELTQGTGIKTYALSLLQALADSGADPHVLISKYARLKDRQYDTDIFALLNEPADRVPIRPWVATVARALCGLPVPLRQRPRTANLILTRGASGFGFVDRCGFFSLPDCFRVAHRLRHYGVTLRISTTPAMDLWHATYPTPIRVAGVPKVTTIHDLTPLRLPHTTDEDKGHFILMLRDAIASSDLLVTVSETVKRELVEFFAVDPERIAVTYQPLALPGAPPTAGETAAVLGSYNLEDQGYILFVGAIEPKKNLNRLIRAYQLLKPDMPLLVIGRKAWMWEPELAAVEQDRRLKRRIAFLDYVPYADLPALYAGARCLAFPSFGEGFGLPALEAMHYGCPVLAASAGALPEICADAAVFADPYDYRSIADALGTLVSDDGLRERLRDAGRARAAFFSMANYRARLADAYGRLR